MNNLPPATLEEVRDLILKNRALIEALRDELIEKVPEMRQSEKSILTKYKIFLLTY